jgi:hypothetical protein
VPFHRFERLNVILKQNLEHQEVTKSKQNPQINCIVTFKGARYISGHSQTTRSCVSRVCSRHVLQMAYFIPAHSPKQSPRIALDLRCKTPNKSQHRHNVRGTLTKQHWETCDLKKPKASCACIHSDEVYLPRKSSAKV